MKKNDFVKVPSGKASYQNDQSKPSAKIISLDHARSANSIKRSSQSLESTIKLASKIVKW